MGAGASAKEAPLESSDPEEQAVYARLKARYDGESPALGSDVERDALYATLKKEYDQWLSDGHDAQAQPRDEALWYSAIVLEVTRSLCDGHLEYTVQYTDEHHHNDDDEHHGHGHPGEDDEHEIEHHLPPAKLRKVQSGRSLTNVQRFKLAGRMVSAMRAFRASGFTHKHHDGGADAKADSKADAAVAALAAKGDAPADEKK